MSDANETTTFTELTTHIVASYVSNNSVAAADLPGLIQSVYGAMTGIRTEAVAVSAGERRAPAVPIKKAVQPDYIVDLFTGLKFKSLKRHLRTKHNMTPEEYRAYWGLPKDSPMVAPNYAAARSALAKSMGLGQGGRKVAAKHAPKARKPKA